MFIFYEACLPSNQLVPNPYFFDADDFTSLEESALVSLLKRNDLQIDEVKIWDYVIKWRIAQTSTLPTNIDDWTKENFLTLKITLQQCLPHICYFHLSAPERPVKSTILLPRSVLVTELPPREEPREPTIISEEHAHIHTLTNIPYNFELILCTLNGFAPQTFWNICHGHACTVVLVKVKGTDEIIGGYNPLTWDKNTDGGTAFFFDFWMYSDKSNFTLDNYCYCNSHCYGYAKPIKSSSSEYFSIINYEG
ncbi:hypothetical protein Glove_421g89 [Diversispora epigaea]|uniref:TLDc domain-containing protein n=1 Tax=Diversispora epigaea TaxID=1348612 RepID=A0A397GV73_9GLOM|nr:hypothetical protein Glove_421g89 [Diversispora epigaea]